MEDEQGVTTLQDELSGALGGLLGLARNMGWSWEDLHGLLIYLEAVEMMKEELSTLETPNLEEVAGESRN